MLELIKNISIENLEKYILELVDKSQCITDYYLKHSNSRIYEFKFNNNPCTLQIVSYIGEYSNFSFYLITHFGSFSFYIFDYTTSSRGLIKETSEIKINWKTFKEYKCDLNFTKVYPKEIKIESKKLEYYLKAFIKCILTNNFEYDLTDSILRLTQTTFIFLDS